MSECCPWCGLPVVGGLDRHIAWAPDCRMAEMLEPLMSPLNLERPVTSET